MYGTDWKEEGNDIVIICWEHIEDNIKCGRYCRNRNPNNRYSLDIINEEQDKRAMPGEKHYQRYASTILKSAKAGNTSAINRVFGVLDNDDGIDETLCTC